MHWWVSCGMIPDSLIKVAQHVNQRRMRGAAGHFFHRKSRQLEMVRETQAHAPARTGVGQELPRDGFAPIAAQIGDVTAQRIPHECLVTLEGPGVDPTTLDAHREPRP